jgi:hypothetical protein
VFILSQLADILIRPSNLIGFLALAGIVSLVLGARRLNLTTLTTAAVFLVVLGWTPLGRAALMALENRFPTSSVHRSMGS